MGLQDLKLTFGMFCLELWCMCWLMGLVVMTKIHSIFTLPWSCGLPPILTFSDFSTLPFNCFFGIDTGIYCQWLGIHLLPYQWPIPMVANMSQLLLSWQYGFYHSFVISRIGAFRHLHYLNSYVKLLNYYLFNKVNISIGMKTWYPK